MPVSCEKKNKGQDFRLTGRGCCHGRLAASDTHAIPASDEKKYSHWLCKLFKFSSTRASRETRTSRAHLFFCETWERSGSPFN